MLGLHHEARGAATPAVLDQWVSLIETYVRCFTQPWREDDRLHKLWETAAGNLARNWTVNKQSAARR